MRSVACVLALALLGCAEPDPVDAGVDAGPPAIGDAGDPAVVAVEVRYEDRPYDARGFTGELVERPAAEVLVELRDATGAVVASGRTDAEGRARLSVDAIAAGPTLAARVSADVLHEGHRARVVDRGPTPKVYALEAPVPVGGAIALVARYADGLGGPFNVVDVSREAFLVYAAHVGAPGPTLTYRWERGRSFECGTCYGDDAVSLGGQVEDTDEYDDDIVLHELAHFWVDHYGRDTSPAGTHRDRQVAPELAYGEGLAYFFACMVRGTPVVVDTFEGSVRVIDIDRYLQNGETRAGFRGVTEDGALREEIVAGIMWDAFDGPADDEPFDRVALGVAAQLRVLTGMRERPGPDVGATGVDLADYLRALECDAGVPAADVQALADDRAYPYVATGC